ncbi:inositol monophosphatase [Actinospica sp. MGRD01-02]|uniref:Inositol-1-monophosphatase n=1 Tax=Actinospica acidithermotolerans TaxID=2828514 RepID=A0A941IJQ9_9ACTN|nr:inositol monophosphatase family protein [Actinospica acidithermotolerans]MBR7829739.1 inositol monophosphatase [Actinospica acidithermotolerans]
MTESVTARELLEIGRAAAAEAGKLLVEGRPADLGVAQTKSSPTDVVTEMDTAAELAIRAAIRRYRPEDGFLGEEGGSEAGTSGVRWIVDPIDGTVNYLYGRPAWAVSIAAEADGETVAGVVLAPQLGEEFTGVRGEGSWLGVRRLRVAEPEGLAKALVATGFGYQARRREVQGRIVAGLIGQVRDIRRGGSAALDLCFVAAGRADGYFERGTNPWDHAAGALIAQEAGARVEGFHGAPASEAMVLAAGTALFPALHDALAALGADDRDY